MTEQHDLKAIFKFGKDREKRLKLLRSHFDNEVEKSKKEMKLSELDFSILLPGVDKFSAEEMSLCEKKRKLLLTQHIAGKFENKRRSILELGEFKNKYEPLQRAIREKTALEEIWKEVLDCDDIDTITRKRKRVPDEISGWEDYTKAKNRLKPLIDEEETKKKKASKKKTEKVWIDVPNSLLERVDGFFKVWHDLDNNFSQARLNIDGWFSNHSFFYSDGSEWQFQIATDRTKGWWLEVIQVGAVQFYDGVDDKALTRLLVSGIRDLGAEFSWTDLLKASSQVVPLLWRDELIEDFHEWWKDSKTVGVGLVTGPGGVGKTRLMIQWCKELREKKIVAGFLPSHKEKSELGPLFGGDAPRVVVIDYAETRVEIVRKILAEVASESWGDRRVRIVLLARDKVDWWNELGEGEPRIRTLLSVAKTEELQNPKTKLSKKQSAEMFNNALSAFAIKLDKATPDVESPDLSLTHFERPLFIQIAALAGLHGKRISGAGELLDEVLIHERDYWRKAVNDLGEAVSARDLIFKTVCCAVPLITLWEKVRYSSEAEEVVRRASNRKLKEELVMSTARLLYRLYGYDSENNNCDNSDEKIEEAEYETGKDRLTWGLQPDIIGEHLISKTLSESGNCQLLNLAFDNARTEQQHSAFTVLNRLSQYSTDARRWLRIVLDKDSLNLAKIAITVATETQGSLPDILRDLLVSKKDPLLAEHVNNLCPHKTIALRGLALESMEQVVRWKLNSTNASEEEEDLKDLATLLNDLALRYMDVGSLEKALSYLVESDEVFYRLNSIKPGEYWSGIAGVRANMGVVLEALNRNRDALNVTSRAVQYFRRMIEVDREVFLSELARCLNLLGKLHMKYGREEESLELFSESIGYYRELVANHGDVSVPFLASALVNLGQCLITLKRHSEALEPLVEAEREYRQLSKNQRDSFLPELARTLVRLGIVYRLLDRKKEAVGC